MGRDWNERRKMDTAVWGQTGLQNPAGARVPEPVPDIESPKLDPEVSTVAPTAAELETLRRSWEELPTMSAWVRKAYDENVRLRWDTHSNAIEGNSLTYSDTMLLLVYGRTRGEHLIREYEEIQGHDAAILHLQDLIAAREPLTETALLHLHRLMLVRPYTARSLTYKGEEIVRTINIGQYKTEPNMVVRPDGSFLPFASPDEVPGRMARFLQDFNADLYIPQTDIAALLAAQHHAIVAIHPFDDGNGRMARLLLNFTVQARGFPALVIEEEAREVYMDALRLADSGDLGPLRDLLAIRLQRALAFGIAVKQQECEPGWRNDTGDPAMPPAGSVYDAERSHTITGT